MLDCGAGVHMYVQISVCSPHAARLVCMLVLLRQTSWHVTPSSMLFAHVSWWVHITCLHSQKALSILRRAGSEGGGVHGGAMWGNGILTP